MGVQNSFITTGDGETEGEGGRGKRVKNQMEALWISIPLILHSKFNKIRKRPQKRFNIFLECQLEGKQYWAGWLLDFMEKEIGWWENIGKYSTKVLSLLDFVIFLFLSIHIHFQKLIRLLNFPSLHMVISFLSRILVLFLSCLRDNDFGECWFGFEA